MKKQKVLKILFLVSCLYFSQTSDAQQANVTSGGDAIGSNGSSSYSIGQVAYINATGSNGSVNQGIQQPYEIFTLGNNHFPEIALLLTVYPNPTTSLVTLKIENLSLENLNYQLFDLNGKQIQSQKINAFETQIQMDNLASAIYLLNVMENNILLKNFKIIKND